MKRQAYTMIATMILAGLVAVSSAKAQSLSTDKLVANIPFEFSVGSKTLPAGEYIVCNINPASPTQVLQLLSRHSKTSAIVQIISVTGKAQENSRLVFRRYGDRYFFAQTWMQGNRNGLEAPRPRAERAMSDRLAGIAPKTETIALTRRR